MRLIDADALMDMVDDTIDRVGNTCVLMNAKDFVRNFINNQPTICPVHSDSEVIEYCVESACTELMNGRCPLERWK